VSTITTFLDSTPADHTERFWLVTRDDGTQEICDAKSKGSRGGMGPSCLKTYREQLATCVEQIEGHAAFWVEFAQELAKNDPLPAANDKVTIIAPSFHAYTAFVEQTGGGFGGDRYDVEMHNGLKFWSRNVWSRGVVPLHMRKLLPPNGIVKGLR
jgi:hypothetical protein